MNRAVRVVLVGCVLAGMLSGQARAGGGTHELVVQKVANGDEPESITYGVLVACDDPNFGTQTSATIDTRNPLAFSRSSADGSAVCTVSEPEDGGAISVAIRCQVESGSARCLASDTVEFTSVASAAVTITVTNTFPEGSDSRTPDLLS